MIFKLLNLRVRSGLGVGLFGLIIVTLGGWWFALAVGLIVHLALQEYFRMAEFNGIRPATKTTLVTCQILLVMTQLALNGIISFDLSYAIMPLSGIAICCWLILQPKTGSISDIAASIFGLFYLGFLPSHWLRLRNFIQIDLLQNIDSSSFLVKSSISSGLAITFMTCLMIVIADIGSFYIGKIFGKKVLSPISPSKTVEGAVGGFVCAIILGGFFGYLLNWNFGIVIGGLLGAMIALLALVGDLTESMLKRGAGIKDSGNALPGHGGILDRIDSYLFTPAIVYYSLILILPYINVF